jgi:hypothetical protein
VGVNEKPRLLIAKVDAYPTEADARGAFAPPLLVSLDEARAESAPPPPDLPPYRGVWWWPSPTGEDPERRIAVHVFSDLDADGLTAKGITPFAPEDPEPVFTIRGQDRFAVRAVGAYYDLCCEAGLMAQAGEVHRALEELRAWQDRHPERIKMPDHAHVPAGGA